MLGVYTAKGEVGNLIRWKEMRSQKRRKIVILNERKKLLISEIIPHIYPAK